MEESTFSKPLSARIRKRKRGEGTGDRTSLSMAVKEKDKVRKDSTDDGLRKANRRNHSDANGVHSSAVAAVISFSQNQQKKKKHIKKHVGLYNLKWDFLVLPV